MRLFWLSGALAAALGVCPVLAADCPGNPGALGTARTIVVDPAKMPRIGNMSFTQSLPLEPKEVVLTFDDGPQPKNTAIVLDALARECVKATFFLIGSLAKEYPEWVRRQAQGGHTIANHNEHHPRYFDKLSYERGIAQIVNATRHIDEALAPIGHKMAPFFRFPGFRHTEPFNRYLNKQGYAVIGADFPADDWTFVGPETVMHRALARLEYRGSGILLLHDIHQRTAVILPRLLRELKARGFKVVHMVPPSIGETPLAAKETAPAPAETASKAGVTIEPVVQQAALKETSAEAVAKEPEAKQSPAASARQSASLRRVHRPARAVNGSPQARDLRDRPD